MLVGACGIVKVTVELEGLLLDISWLLDEQCRRSMFVKQMLSQVVYVLETDCGLAVGAPKPNLFTHLNHFCLVLNILRNDFVQKV